MCNDRDLKAPSNPCSSSGRLAARGRRNLLLNRLSFYLFIIHLLFVCVASTAAAGFIRLDVVLTSRLEDGRLVVQVSAVNRGDEPAHSVRAEISAEGGNIWAESERVLPVNGTYRAEVRIPVNLGNPGSRPLALVMHYMDANHYPFSALTVQTYGVGAGAAPSLFGQVKSATIAKTGKVHFVLKNSGDREIEADVRLLSPRELTVRENGKGLSVPPKGERGGFFHLENFSALPGSDYQIFVVASFENAGVRATAIAPGTVRITAARTLFGFGYPFALAILLILIAVAAGIQLIRK
jgi:hypothetical protein